MFRQGRHHAECTTITTSRKIVLFPPFTQYWCYQLKSPPVAIPGASNTCIFSHILVSPEDIEAPLSEKVCMRSKQLYFAFSVIPFLSSRLPETENTRKHLKNTLICHLTLPLAWYRRSPIFVCQSHIVQMKSGQRTASKNLSVIWISNLWLSVV
jgi:hypothetical protein